MALEATHVRFALALQSQLNVADAVAYCSGSVYPDSRAMTGIERIRTHGTDCPHDPAMVDLTDFERGWGTHLMYDEFQTPRLRALLPKDIGDMKQNSRAWTEVTAMKIVEDMMCVRAMDSDLQYLRNLAIDASPRGEDIDLIRRHFAVTGVLYSTECTLEDYMDWIRGVGAQTDLISEIRTRTEQILLDIPLRKEIESIFDDAVRESVLKIL